MMSQLRQQVREDAEETIDYDAYADDIRAMLDKHIGGVSINEPEGAYLVGNMGKEANPETLSDDEARNRRDRITGRVTRKIEQDLADDPYAESQVDARDVEGLPTERFAELDQKNRRHVQAYYGLFLMQLGESSPLSEDQCFDYSIKIDEVVRNAVAEYSINPQEIENQIRVGLLPLLFQDIGVDKAQAIIADVIQITRLGLSG